MDDSLKIRVRLFTPADEQAWLRLRHTLAAVIADDPDYTRIVVIPPAGAGDADTD